jgi:hypothetical protein
LNRNGRIALSSVEAIDFSPWFGGWPGDASGAAATARCAVRMLAAPTAADPASRLRRVGDDDTSVIFISPMLAVPLRQHTKHDGIKPEMGRRNYWTMVSRVLWYRSLLDILQHDPYGFEAARVPGHRNREAVARIWRSCCR